jgi:hypothetical protein
MAHNRAWEGEDELLGEVGGGDVPVAHRLDGEDLPGPEGGDDPDDSGAARQEGDAPARVAELAQLGRVVLDQRGDIAGELEVEPGRVRRPEDDILHRRELSSYLRL